MQAASDSIAQYIQPNDTLIVAVSGGPDSTALLDSLHDFSKKTPCKIIVAHVNHGIRGKKADFDEKFVRISAKRYGFKCYVKKVRLSGSHLEERGRQIRRAFFEKLRKKYAAKWIITAHTLDDQIETVIFNFIRGSGISGLAGMQIAEGFYLKPFLNIQKAAILRHLKTKKMKFCVDKTNFKTRFSRNLIRLKIRPMMEKLNPSLKNTLIRNSEIFHDLEKWLLDGAKTFLRHQKILKLKKSGEQAGFIFKAKDFLALPRPVRQEVIKTIFKEKTGASYNLPFVKMREILEMIKKNIGKKKIYVAKREAFYIDKGKVYWRTYT